MKYGAMINHKTGARSVLPLLDSAKVGEYINGAMIQWIGRDAEDAWGYHEEVEATDLDTPCSEPREVPSSDCSCPL